MAAANSSGIDLVIVGFAAVDGFHGEGVAEHEGDVLVFAQIAAPVPGEHALDTDDEVIAERRDGPQEGVGVGVRP
jgi:hypothetical protein